MLQLLSKDVQSLYETPIVQQTTYWSELKSILGYRSMAFEFKVSESAIRTKPQNQYYVGDLLVILQPVSRDHTLAYVPYGPELVPDEPFQGPFLEELSESIRGYLPQSCIAIRYDLAWESLWADDPDRKDEEGYWTGPPEKQYQEFRFNYFTEKRRLQKSNGDLLPANTFFVDLNSSESELLSSMKSKTRYNIRLAERKGVEVFSGTEDRLPEWYRLYETTAWRNGMTVNGIEYFQSVIEARKKSKDAQVELLMARHGDQLLSAMFLVLTGNRATYLYGASAEEKRSFMPSYALQWKAMKLAKEAGCVEYDFFGTSPKPDPAHPMNGLYKFKSGFGGEIKHLMGCWDYPYIGDAYRRFISSELNDSGYHL